MCLTASANSQTGRQARICAAFSIFRLKQAGFVRRFAFRLIEPDAGPIFHHFIGDVTDGAI